jgi:hypothetical protein
VAELHRRPRRVEAEAEAEAEAEEANANATSSLRGILGRGGCEDEVDAGKGTGRGRRDNQAGGEG